MIRWPDEARAARRFRAGKPFAHLVIDGLLASEDHARLAAGFPDEPLAPAESDIYQQLRGSEPPMQPALRAFCESLAGSCARVSRICGRPLSWADGCAYVYLPGQYLLPHSDSRASEGRALAYAYYVGAPEEGGELELFACATRAGRIVRTRPAKRIAPRANRMVLFEVKDTALHQVCEVLRGARASIAGWFYP